MKCPTCHVDLKFADEGQKRIEYCPGCRHVWAFSGILYPIGRSPHKGRSQTDAAPDRAGDSHQKPLSSNWDGNIGGFYLPKRKRHTALENLLNFLCTAAKHSF